MARYPDWIPPQIASKIFHCLRGIPYVSRRVDREYDKILAELEPTVRPYQDTHPTYARLPARGRDKDDLLKEMEEIKAAETAKWKEGFVSGAVYHGDEEHIDFLNRVYALHSQSNPLHPDVWPSSTKYESEIVAMTAAMLGAQQPAGDARADETICGVVSSGGTESILLAMKTYRDRARARQRVKQPEMIAPATAHVAFGATMSYWPQQKDYWGQDHQVSLVWIVQMLVDLCNAEDFQPSEEAQGDAEKHDEEYKAWCSQPQHRDERLQVVQTYPEDWLLSGLAMREDYGVRVAIAFEDPQTRAAGVQPDQYLTLLAYGLDRSFVAGRDCDTVDQDGNCTEGDGQRDVTVADIQRRFDAGHNDNVADE